MYRGWDDDTGYRFRLVLAAMLTVADMLGASSRRLVDTENWSLNRFAAAP